MLKEEYNKEKLQHLASQIARLSMGVVQANQLGYIALEILIMRNKVEDVLEKKVSKQERAEAKKALEQLRRLEKSIIQLYLISRFRKQSSNDLFLDYISQRHSFMEG